MWRPMSDLLLDPSDQHVVSYKVTKLAVIIPLKMATIADVRESLSSLPDEPHRPKRFAFLNAIKQN